MNHVPSARFAAAQVQARWITGHPTYRHPAFPTREVRAAEVRCGDVLADPATSEPLTVVGVGWSSGAAIVLYVRRRNARHPGATHRLHFTADEYVLRATDPAHLRAVHPGHERTTP